MSPADRDPAIQRRADSKARAGRTERRILISRDHAAKATLLVGNGTREGFSAFVLGLVRGAAGRAMPRGGDEE